MEHRQSDNDGSNANDLEQHAKDRILQGDNTYMADIELALQAYTDPLSPDEIISLIELTSAQQVVNARANHVVTDNMLQTLVQHGREQEAIMLARLRKSKIEQFNGLFAIWENPKSEHVSVAELIQLADQKSAYRPHYELCKLAVALARVNDPRADDCFAKARENILSMIDVDSFPSRDNGRTTVADYLMLAQRFDEAQEVAETIESPSRRDLVLKMLSSALAHVGRIEQAHQVADSISYEPERVSALNRIAVILADDANQQVQETIESVEDSPADSASQHIHEITFTPQDMPIDADYQKTVTLRLLAVSLARAGDPLADDMFGQAREATNSLRKIRNSNRKHYAQRQLATVLAEYQRFDEAHEIAIKIDHDFVRADTLQTIATIIAKADMLRMGEDSQKSHEIAIASQGQKASSRLETVIQARRFDEAREITNAITNRYKQSKAQCYFVSALAQARRFDEAYEIIEVMDIQFISQKAIALCDIAIGLAQVQRFDEAYEIAEIISVASQKATALFNIALASAQVNDTHSNEVFSQAQVIAEMIQDSYRQEDVYIELAIVLVQAQRIDKARQVVDNIDNNEVKASFLLQLAVTLSQSDDSRADEFFQQALSVADSIEYEIAKADTLGKIGVALAQAHHLDQAEALAEASQYDALKIDIWIALVPALIEAQEFDKAHAIALKIPDGFDTKDVRGQLIRALLANNKLKHALIVVGLCDVESYVSFLAECQPVLAEQYPDHPNLWQRMMLSALEIICWVRKDYEPIRDTFRMSVNTD